FPELDVGAVVAEERRLDPGGLAAGAEELGQDAAPELHVRLPGGVVRPAEVPGPGARRDQLGVHGVVGFAREHPGALGVEAFVVHVRGDAGEAPTGSRRGRRAPRAGWVTPGS